MKKLGHLVAFLCCLLLACFTAGRPPAMAEEKGFPPFYVKKLAPGEQFTPFEIVDLDGRNWSNRRYLTRPMLLITGKWALRHDLRKWAEHLNIKYTLVADTLWVFNPNSGWFEDRRQRSEDAFKEFNPKIPTLIDSHSLIGRSLRIEYDIPTIIGIDRHNRYQFALESPFNKPGSEKLDALIRSKLLHD
ncbi:MAG: hypothetical protein CVV42_09075 [Candidatus Riflebacteria bacterium HGW-Riflebacteria-2]|jgi:hypothetical protein|nr:MAG: hypothetical protein CVV42_09075 [Candidatus Riflebacteria bacterium HGW-Riflebacteria-2]